MNVDSLRSQEAPLATPKKSEVEKLKTHMETLRGNNRQLHTDKLNLQRSLDKERARADTAEERLGRVTQIKAADAKIPAWVARKPRGKRAHHATPVTVWSDLHLDEVVQPDEVDGRNAYNRAVAESRFQRLVDSTVELMRSYVAGVTFDGIVVALGGDIITGTIHEELEATNEATVPQTIVHWVQVMASGITSLADEFGAVFVPCVDGNHDRSTRKIRYKQRAEMAWSWVFYNWLADVLRDDKRVTFSISKSPDLIFPVYDTRFLLTHGDAFRGGGGVGGIYPPMLRWLTKKHVTHEFDIALIGHWHQLLYGQGIYVNGSLKGWDEFALGHGFGFERPQQMLFVVTPENGVTIKTQVYADNTKERDLWYT